MLSLRMGRASRMSFVLTASGCEPQTEPIDPCSLMLQLVRRSWFLWTAWVVTRSRRTQNSQLENAVMTFIVVSKVASHCYG